ncbi:MAG: glycosyltransferase [Bacteroidia bacterium]|nr:glycosyltransferase [Bacteroidia bacterium]
MKLKKRILVAPLNWGLGHATRCIPIINALINFEFEPIIASDGAALQLLKKEFSSLKFVKLPSYNISYPENGKQLKVKLLKDSPKIIKAINKEHLQVEALVDALKIDGIISDNRYGVYHKNVPSVFITHQLNVLSGNTTWLSSKIQQLKIAKFDLCWIPDVEDHPNLSGELGHLSNTTLPLKYIGAISRFNKVKSKKKYDLMVLLSGPEPQRTLLEELLFNEIKNFKGNVLFVKGIIDSKQQTIKRDHLTLVNFMQTQELETAISESEVILSRSGYTTILDLVKMEKKAFFIPTPGQFEQEYLANRLEENGIAPYCTQDNFNINELKRIKEYSGFKKLNYNTNYKDLFRLF